MSLPQWSDRPYPRPPAPAKGPALSARIDWDDWVRATERKRRLLARGAGGGGGERQHPPLPADFFARSTAASFRLDGLGATDRELAEALSPGTAGKAFRSRPSQRIRNHVAVLRHVETILRRGRPLQPDLVVRWYTSISCGLSTTRLDDPTHQRLAEVVTHVNSPQMRLRPAIEDIAQLHHRLLTDPFVPAFNGILARLILHYHLGRCGLPIVVFDPAVDQTPFRDASHLLRRLMELLGQRYDGLLAV